MILTVILFSVIFLVLHSIKKQEGRSRRGRKIRDGNLKEDEPQEEEDEEPGDRDAFISFDLISGGNHRETIEEVGSSLYELELEMLTSFLQVIFHSVCLVFAKSNDYFYFLLFLCQDSSCPSLVRDSIGTKDEVEVEQHEHLFGTLLTSTSDWFNEGTAEPERMHHTSLTLPRRPPSFLLHQIQVIILFISSPKTFSS